MSIKDWSTTAANNNSSAPNGWPTGMPPSDVKLTGREMMASVRSWYEDAEWINFGFTVSGLSADTFEVTGATSTATDWFNIGRRVRLHDGANTFYGSVESATISSANTNVTVNFDTTSVSLTSSLSIVDVGIIRGDKVSEPNDWVAYTPTFVGFGTVSNVQVYSRRSGNTLYLRGRFQGGTTTATEGRITLGVNGVEGNVTSSNIVITGIQLAGNATTNTVGAAIGYTLIEANVGYITFGLQSSSRAGLSKVNGSAILSNSSVMSFTAEVPIDTWPSN